MTCALPLKRTSADCPLRTAGASTISGAEQRARDRQLWRDSKSGFQDHQADIGLGVWIVTLKGASESRKEHIRDEPQDEKCCERGPPRPLRAP